MDKTIVMVLVVAGCLMAQGQDESQQSPKEQTDRLTTQGCVSRSIDRYILMQPDPGHSYGLEATGKIKFDQYLGQQVEVVGNISPTASTSSTSRHAFGPAETIVVDSIHTIAKRCTH